MTIARAIESALGSEVLIQESGDYTFDEQMPLAVAPSSPEHFSELMKLASAERWSVTPAGEGRWLEAGNPSEFVDIIASTRRLAPPILHMPDDLLATVGAGVSLSALDDALAAASQWWPLDPLGDGSVGAVIATGSAGPLAADYGTPREMVLGMKVVLADGRIVNAGGRTVKNVAGYDMVKLFTGSWGTLGIVIEAHLRLHPRPPGDKTLGLFATAPEMLASLARDFGRTHALAPSAIEILSPSANDALQISATEWLMIVRWLGDERAVEESMDAAFETANRHSTRAEEIAAPWMRLSRIEESLSPVLTLRLSGPPLATDELVTLAIDFVAGETPGVVASPMLGRVWCFVGSAAYAEEAAEDWASRVEALREAARKRRGYLRLERAPLRLRSLVDSWGDPGATLSLQRALRSKFDPHRILNRGRFVGGL